MRFIRPLCLVLILLILVSCTNSADFSIAISDYLEALTDMDFDAIWDSCEPSVTIDKDTFIQKYKAIFSGLGITEISITDQSEADEFGNFFYTAVYHTKEFGNFQNNFDLSVVHTDGQNKIYWDYSLIFPEMDLGYNVRVKTLHATRGEMFAQDGSLVAANSYAKTIYMDVNKVVNIADVVNALEPVTGLTDTDAVKLFNEAREKGRQIEILGTLPELTEEQEQTIVSVAGLGIDEKAYTPIRKYPLCESAAHIIGYTGYAPSDKNNLEKIGIKGLEESFETELKGKDGKIVFIEDNFGKNVKTLFEQPAQQGQDLWLTIKPWLQRKAYNLLSDNLEQDQSGVAIVIDAENGFVEAIAAYPSYDNNIFSFAVPKDEWERLTKGNQPFLSRATQEWYPPGSVIKPFIAASALNSGVISPDTEFSGKIVDNKWTPEESGWTFPPIKRVYNSGSPLKLSNALVHSDNIYFAYAALKMGKENMFESLENLGFNEAVPFDIPTIKANLINPNREVTRKIIADMGYGQADLLITPIQLSAMYTAFANGTGDMLKPILVNRICRTEGNSYTTILEREAEVWKSNAIDKNSLKVLRPMLADVISSGTGKHARISGVEIAGKTGTAEKDKTREISWFAGYWTKGYYKRLVIVMVDVETEKGEIKFNIAKALLSP